MATAVKKINKISQTVSLKQVMQRWKNMSLRCRSSLSADSDDTANRRIPSGFLAVYAGHKCNRFLIPTRFLKLPVFLSLLQKAEDEFGFQSDGGLVLPCEAGFLEQVLKYLETNEARFGRLDLEEFTKIVSEVSFDSCKETAAANACHLVTPLLQKAKV